MGQAQAKMRRKSAPSRPVTHVPEHLPGAEGASSTLRNLSQAVYGLAPWAPTILGHTQHRANVALAPFCDTITAKDNQGNTRVP